jgi:hypothetical protein
MLEAIRRWGVVCDVKPKAAEALCATLRLGGEENIARLLERASNDVRSRECASEEFVVIRVATFDSPHGK